MGIEIQIRKEVPYTELWDFFLRFVVITTEFKRIQTNSSDKYCVPKTLMVK